MKRYGLVQCWPVGFGSNNRTIAETKERMTFAQAVEYFNSLNNEGEKNFALNSDGYNKVGSVTYCVAECYESH